MQPELRRPKGELHVDWRYRCLRNAGFSHTCAHRLADDRDFDLHALLGLVDRGCPPDLAVRIVAPLEREGRAP